MNKKRKVFMGVNKRFLFLGYPVISHHSMSTRNTLGTVPSVASLVALRIKCSP